ncbi:MAG: hypothetical protein ACT4RN_12270 [Pseudonocardia sp.]
MTSTTRVPDTQAVRGATEQLRWFTTLWVMALVFHYSDSHPLAMLPVLGAGVAALLFPASAAALAVFLGAAAVVAVLHLPAASNHLVLSLLVGLALAGAALHARTGAGSFTARWLDGARTPAGLVLLVVYAFTVFHKLNTAFLDPATSCAGSLLAQLAALNGVTFDPSPAVVGFAAVATVVVEAAILVLLAVPRWRRWGIAVGVGFHAVLAPASFFDFATVVFALYVLLAPRSVFVELAPRWAVARRVALTAFGAHVVLAVGGSVAGTTGTPWHTLLVVTWFVAVGALMVPFVRACLRSPAQAWPRWRWRPVVLLLVPLLALANGAAPYLGFKTVASYSMFSNLHTENGATNHLLPGVGSLELAGHQRDLVTVTEVRPPERAELTPLTTVLGGASYLRRAARWTTEPAPVVVPWLELRRTVLLWRDAGIRDVGVVYLRDGVRRDVADATADPELAAAMPWWQRHLVAFRAVDSGAGPDRCRW